MMDWYSLLNGNRLGVMAPESVTPDRTTFQRDFDRIVFSSSFRRLQSKTQIFPLPKADFIHTRLTHSLEASCVGRSLGSMIGTEIYYNSRKEFSQNGLYPETFSSIVAAACLAHDIGNPPFGHSGEDAISSYFESEKAARFIDGLTDRQVADLQNFEGNALGFRLLTHTLHNKAEGVGGMHLTCGTLGAFTKYPKESLPQLSDSERASERKFGFFQSEQAIFQELAENLGLIKKDIGGGIAYSRHPLAFLVEAADDICYLIMDLEDGCKFKLVSFERTKELLMDVIQGDNTKINIRLKALSDEREMIGYLRAKAINSLVKQVSQAFLDNVDEMLNGEFDKHLVDCIPSGSAMKAVQETAVNHIYNYRKVVEIEAAGFEILGGLCDRFLNAAFYDSRHDRQVRQLIPDQYLSKESDKYGKIMDIMQFISGMTDTFALDTFRVITGISLPSY